MTHSRFNLHEVLHHLKHFLPAQAPLMDFVHHNTLHAFQHLPFHEALRQANIQLGYQVYLSLNEYRDLYKSNRIDHQILDIQLQKKKSKEQRIWKEKLIHHSYEVNYEPRVGSLRGLWKKKYGIDLDSLIHPNLFRLISGFLDQGISIWNFPIENLNFLEAIRKLENESYSSLFRSKKTRKLLHNEAIGIEDLLHQIVGNRSDLYEQYLFDQQFAHQGWSGMVSTVEDFPQSLLDSKKIQLSELIFLELLLEIDNLNYLFGENNWSALENSVDDNITSFHAKIDYSEYMEVLSIWQEAFEWSFYDQVLGGIQISNPNIYKSTNKSFQGLFCIDDRECSLRRHLENFDPNCETFGTPGFFGVEFYYQPVGGKFLTKLCPAPVTPKYLIKEIGSGLERKKDLHFSKHNHNFYTGWIMSQTLGFWSAVKLFANIFKPGMSPATASSLRHIDQFSKLKIDFDELESQQNNLQVGFKIDEMVSRVESLLKSIGLVNHFADIVYVIGHGASSVNNPHYAAYDCGACSGRAGSVNARVVSQMANKKEVRALLKERGISIPDTTIFVGGLHDTTRDDIVFYDEEITNPIYKIQHENHVITFTNALDANAKERSRRFESIDTHQNARYIHSQVRKRSVSLFEPRPELNHATNALCLVGRRDLSKGLFLDRRSFLNSYDYQIDPDGNYLFNILKAAAPVCGGINLEYYFSRVDQEKLGAGTKLPHNVMGLFGVANGIDGDLRPGLPVQMTEVHDPIRLLLMVEHFPKVILEVIQRNNETYEWFINEWVVLVAIHPETRETFLFKNGDFEEYLPFTKRLEFIDDLDKLLESHQENFPVYLINQV
ncbi:MAG: hypothetical protein RJA76_202 [Bacteroidota bacterium]|jgi:uncharacterized protein YbcC (UPF0753/DUF2309 family)